MLDTYYLSLHQLYVCSSSVHISFLMTSKHQLIFTKLGVCIDVVEIYFGIANGQILSIFDRVICPRHALFSFPEDNLSKCQGILIKLGTCIDIKEIWFGIANRQISSILDSVICLRQDNCGVLSFYVFIRTKEVTKVVFFVKMAENLARVSSPLQIIFPTRLCKHPAKTEISLRIRTV